MHSLLFGEIQYSSDYLLRHLLTVDYKEAFESGSSCPSFVSIAKSSERPSLIPCVAYSITLECDFQIFNSLGSLAGILSCFIILLRLFLCTFDYISFIYNKNSFIYKK